MMFSDPRGGSEHGHRGENEGDNAPGKNGFGRVQGNMIPEGKDDCINVPSDSGGSTS